MTSETSSKEIERYVTASNLLSPRQVSVDIFVRIPREIREAHLKPDDLDQLRRDHGLWQIFLQTEWRGGGRLCQLEALYWRGYPPYGAHKHLLHG